MATPTNTLQTCRDIFYWILRETEDVQAYPLVLADSFINKAQLAFCSGNIRNPLTWDVAQKWRLPFLNTDKFYENYSTIYLTAKWVLNGTTLTVWDNSSYPATWKLYLAWKTLAYTGKPSSTSFTGVDALPFAFKNGSPVDLAHDLPSDYLSPIQLIYNNNRKLDAMQYDDIFETLNARKWYNWEIDWYWANMLGSFYTIKDWETLLVFNAGNSGEMLHLRYEKKPTKMVEKTDLMTIDVDEYSHLIVWYFAVWDMLFNRWEEQRGAELINQAISLSRELYSLYNNSTMERQSGKQYKTGKRRRRRLNI